MDRSKTGGKVLALAPSPFRDFPGFVAEYKGSFSSSQYLDPVTYFKDPNLGTLYCCCGLVGCSIWQNHGLLKVRRHVRLF